MIEFMHNKNNGLPLDVLTGSSVSLSFNFVLVTPPLVTEFTYKLYYDRPRPSVADEMLLCVALVSHLYIPYWGDVRFVVYATLG